MSKYFIGLAHFAIRSIYFHFINFQFITVRFKILRYSCVCASVRATSLSVQDFWVRMDSVPISGTVLGSVFEGYTVPESISGPIERSRSRLSVSRPSLEGHQKRGTKRGEGRAIGRGLCLRYALDAITATNRRFQVKDPRPATQTNGIPIQWWPG